MVHTMRGYLRASGLLENNSTLQLVSALFNAKETKMVWSGTNGTARPYILFTKLDVINKLA